MGCGQSKGKEPEVTEINFKNVGIWDLDQFFTEAKAVLDGFSGLTEPLKEAKEFFFEATGFYEVPGAGKHISLTYILHLLLYRT